MERGDILGKNNIPWELSGDKTHASSAGMEKRGGCGGSCFLYWCGGRFTKYVWAWMLPKCLRPGTHMNNVLCPQPCEWQLKQFFVLHKDKNTTKTFSASSWSAASPSPSSPSSSPLSWPPSSSWSSQTPSPSTSTSFWEHACGKGRFFGGAFGVLAWWVPKIRPSPWGWWKTME